MTQDFEEEEIGAEVRVCAVCGHAEDEHRVLDETAERGRQEVCLLCNSAHAFEPRVEEWPPQ